MKTGSILIFGLILLIWPAHGSGPMVLHNFRSDRHYSDRDGHDYEPSREQSDSHSAFDFAKEAVQGAGDMWKAYTDMREANYIGADKYFHARGNHDAAERGPGGKWAAEVISDARECLQGSDEPDSIADQEANKWGREGGDPNKYRPEGLPENY